MDISGYLDWKIQFTVVTRCLSMLWNAVFENKPLKGGGLFESACRVCMNPHIIAHREQKPLQRPNLAHSSQRHIFPGRCLFSSILQENKNQITCKKLRRNPRLFGRFYCAWEQLCSPVTSIHSTKSFVWRELGEQLPHVFENKGVEQIWTQPQTYWRFILREDVIVSRMKKFVTDGLLQIALLLSILRTDLNLHSYLNLVDNHLTYPEIHDIILGSSHAYTQTSNFHNNHWHNSISGGYAHPKSIDNFYANSVFRELHSLSHYRRFGDVRTHLESYLVTTDGQLVAPFAGNANDNSNGATSSGNGGNSGGGVLPGDNDGNGDSVNVPNEPSSPEGAVAPGTSGSDESPQSLPTNSNSFLQHPGSELSKEVTGNTTQCLFFPHWIQVGQRHVCI